jgi:predicted dehydrogenase
MNTRKCSRRRFVASSAVGLAAVSLVPRHAVAGSGTTPPSERINLAGIGVGGMGAGDIRGLGRDNNVVALCDVDQQRAADTFKNFPTAKRFRDFHKMFDALEKQIDAVVVATPDHFHAVAAMAAIRRNKHVYCEKPLAHSVYEVRQLMQAARAHKVVTQLGNQGHSSDTIRMFCEWIWDGAIGQVHTIHAGCKAINSGIDNLTQLREHHDVPATLDWDQWLGPAQKRDYHPTYCPAHWRGWTPFGNGTVGDWLCHVVDPVFWALDLGAPRTILAEPCDKDYDPKTMADVFPRGDHITFEFPARAARGPVTLHWYSGTAPIPRHKDLEPGRQPVTTGAYVSGDKGTIMYGSHGAGGVRIIPEARMKQYKLPEKKLPRTKGHHRDFLDAIRNGTRAGSDFFAYGGPLTELAVLGVIGLKFPGVKLSWDAAQMKFPNCPAADRFVNPPYRAGWTL